MAPRSSVFPGLWPQIVSPPKLASSPAGAARCRRWRPRSVAWPRREGVRALPRRRPGSRGHEWWCPGGALLSPGPAHRCQCGAAAAAPRAGSSRRAPLRMKRAQRRCPEIKCFLFKERRSDPSASAVGADLVENRIVCFLKYSNYLG